MIKLLVHIANQEPIIVEVDELPSPSDSAIIGRNPVTKKETEVSWIDEGVKTIILPWWRINFIEVLPDASDEEDILKPYRD